MVAPWLTLVTMGLVLAMVPLVEPQQPHLAAAPLCGRAFLRAVIFHCGGSRWRRDGKEGDMWHGEELEGDASMSQWPWIGNEVPFAESWELSGRESETPAPWRPKPAMDTSWEPGPQDIRSPNLGSRTRPRRHLSSMSTKCCLYGCTMNDISTIC